MRRLLALIVVAWMCQGCFVLDELDKGNDILDQHGGRSKKTSGAAQPEPEAADEGGQILGMVARAQTWWKEWREPKPPERDPEDVVVRCDVAGSLQFTRKFDCQVRGGRVL